MAPLQLRSLGKTGLLVSERAFGAWAIGGSAYGPVSPDDAAGALSRAEELGCNLVDTAAVYGESEAVLGRFLRVRRDRWIVATKFSAQPEGMTATVERQLKRLGIETIDIYHIHWAPSREEAGLYAELERLKAAGKIRYAGVSLRMAGDVARVLEHEVVDCLQMPVSLLDPDPLASALQLLRQHPVGVIARSALRGGFLAGSYQASSRFEGANDQRSRWTAAEIRRLARQADAFRFLVNERRSLRQAALAYPLSFPEVSTLIVGCKNTRQAEENFGATAQLEPAELQRISELQRRLRLGYPGRLTRLWRRVSRRLRGRH